MAWPPAAGGLATGFGYVGNLPVTLGWGTDGLYTQTSTVVVLTMRPSQIVEEIPIENGSGVISTQVLIIQGQQVEITVLDDRSIVTWPVVGQTLTLNSPLPNGAGATSLTLQLVDNSYNAARKSPGERTMLAKRYTLITPGAIGGASPIPGS